MHCLHTRTENTGVRGKLSNRHMRLFANDMSRTDKEIVVLLSIVKYEYPFRNNIQLANAYSLLKFNLYLFPFGSGQGKHAVRHAIDECTFKSFAVR